MKGDYAVWVPIEVTLSDSSNGYINATSAAEITAALGIVTVGIGAGPVCDAQWLVMHDLLGLNARVPSFAKTYANLADVARGAFAAYVRDVRDGAFPPVP